MQVYTKLPSFFFNEEILLSGHPDSVFTRFGTTFMTEMIMGNKIVVTCTLFGC